jgi:hypothetical protein
MGLSHEFGGPKISAKIKIYILKRAELLFPLSYEIPCETRTFILCRLANMLNNFVNFRYSIIKKLLYLAHGKLVNILGGHGIGINIHGGQPNPRNNHLCTKTGQKLKLLLGTVPVLFFNSLLNML